MRHNGCRWNDKMIAKALKNEYAEGAKYQYIKGIAYVDSWFSGYTVTISDIETGRTYDRIHFSEEEAENIIDKYDIC